MTLLPQAEVDDMRAEAEEGLPDTCTIQTDSKVNVKGSVESTFANTYTNVPCRLASINRAVAERLIGMALAAVSDHVLTVKFNQDVPPTARVVHNGITYEVTAIANDDASWRTVHRAYLKRIQ